MTWLDHILLTRLRFFFKHLSNLFAKMKLNRYAAFKVDDVVNEAYYKEQ